MAAKVHNKRIQRTGKRDPRVHYFRWNQWPKYWNSSRWGDCTLRPYILNPRCFYLTSVNVYLLFCSVKLYWLSCLWIRSSRFKVLVDFIIYFDGGRNFSVQFRLLPGQTLNVLSPSNLKDTSSANWIILNSLSENSLFLHDNSSANVFNGETVSPWRQLYAIGKLEEALPLTITDERMFV